MVFISLDRGKVELYSDVNFTFLKISLIVVEYTEVIINYKYKTINKTTRSESLFRFLGTLRAESFACKFRF